MAGSAGQQGDAGGVDNRYYMPLIDLLASLVVILVLIIAASVLMQRSDFAAAEQTQQVTERLRQVEARIRTLELTYVYPRDPAAALARRVALHLRDSAARADSRTPVALHTSEAALIVPIVALFSEDDPLRLATTAEPFLAALGSALVRQAGCRPRIEGSCLDLQGGELNRFLVLVRPARPKSGRLLSDLTVADRQLPTDLADIQAAQLIAGLLAATPALVRLRGPDGRSLLEAASFAEPNFESAGCKTGCVEFHVTVTPLLLPKHVRPAQ